MKESMYAPRLNKVTTRKRWSIAAVLMIAYLWWLVTTPEYSNTFAFLVTIRFERILAVLILLAILFGKKIKHRFAIDPGIGRIQ